MHTNNGKNPTTATAVSMGNDHMHSFNNCFTPLLYNTFGFTENAGVENNEDADVTSENNRPVDSFC